MNHPQRATIAVAAALLALALGLMTVFIAGEAVTAVSSEEPLALSVQRGESLSVLTHRLEAEGLIEHPALFRVLAILRGDTHRIRAGEYVLQGRISPGGLLDELVSGSPRMFRFTVPEGFALQDIAARLEAKGKGEAETFLGLVRDPAFIASLELPFDPPPPHLEGLLFPDTYYFAAGTSEAALIREMVSEFKRRVGPLLNGAAQAAGLAPYEAVTLASIIEKETGAAFERELISAVFHNRLKSDMRLSSDPTVIYGIDAFDGNLTRRHLQTPTPYNTYRKHGLPPTPIANPGLESIMAALSPADVDYLFFVSKGDGTHHFSKTFEAHNRAVWRYQKNPARRRRPSS